MYNLPPELLGEIFIRCLPEDTLDLQPSSNVPPLVLCHVCRSWRIIALGTPRLWNELSMELKYATTESGLAEGFLRKIFDALEFWGSHMHALLPSLHFQAHGNNAVVSDDDMHNLVPYQAFFRSPVILKAQLLTLDGFPFGPSTLSNILCNNLEYLAVNHQYSGSSLRSPFQFPTCLTLRRLHVQYHSPFIVTPTILTAYPWQSITHLSANLTLRRQDLYAILAQCVNMTSCSVALYLSSELPANKKDPTLHHNLRVLSVQGGIEEFDSVFSRFVFPSLVSLRLSCTKSWTSLEDVHQAITATPGLKEFHLHFCRPLSITNFLCQPDDAHLAGPLSNFAPGLAILVIDRITSSILAKSTAEDIFTLLHSSWLNDGWPSLSCGQMSVEFIVDDQDYPTPGPFFVDYLNWEFGRCASLPFRASARYVPGGLWNWKKLNARELRDRWDDILAFHCS